MSTQRRRVAQLPKVLVATGLVVAIPLGIVWGLSETGAITSIALLALAAVGLGLLVSLIGDQVWRRAGSSEVLGELMIWIWLHQLIYERRIARAVAELDNAQGLNRAEWAERLENLSSALEAADPYTHGHSRRVARYSARIAQRLGLGAREIALIRDAAAVHDVGKINIPLELLRKPGALTAAEFDAIKRHAPEGAEMVTKLGDPDLTLAVRYHHERLDGSGYPEGLVDRQIPLGARIIAVADTFDAVTSSRPYHRAKSRRAGMRVLTAEAGRRLDAEAVRAFHAGYSGARPRAVLTLMTSAPERAIAATGGAFSTLSASTVAAIVAVIAVAVVGVTNPSRVAGVVGAVPLPGIVKGIISGGESESNGTGAGPQERKAERRGSPGRIAAVAPSPAVAGPAVAPGTGESSEGGKPSSGAKPPAPAPGPEPKEPKPEPEPEPGPGPGPEPGPEPEPEPEPEPDLINEVLAPVPEPLGSILRDVTDPFFPPGREGAGQ